MSDQEDNNNEEGPEVNVVEFAGFKDRKLEEAREARENKPPFEWPRAASNEDTILSEETASAAPPPESDPNERTLLLSLADGDIVMRGYIGVGNSFVCVGDKNGQIKFAANSAKWNYVTDVTDKPSFWANYKKPDGPTEEN